MSSSVCFPFASVNDWRSVQRQAGAQYRSKRNNVHPENDVCMMKNIIYVVDNDHMTMMAMIAIKI